MSKYVGVYKSAENRGGVFSMQADIGTFKCTLSRKLLLYFPSCSCLGFFFFSFIVIFLYYTVTEITHIYLTTFPVVHTHSHIFFILLL